MAPVACRSRCALAGLNPENPDRNNRPEHGQTGDGPTRDVDRATCFRSIDHRVVPVGHDSLREIASGGRSPPAAQGSNPWRAGGDGRPPPVALLDGLACPCLNRMTRFATEPSKTTRFEDAFCKQINGFGSKNDKLPRFFSDTTSKPRCRGAPRQNYLRRDAPCPASEPTPERRLVPAGPSLRADLWPGTALASPRPKLAGGGRAFTSFVWPRMYGSNGNGPGHRSDNRGRARWCFLGTG